MTRFDAAPLAEHLHTVDVGEIRAEEPLSRHTTLHVGGPADAMVFPERSDQVLRLLAVCGELGVPVFPLGRGSNLLVRDEGIRGVVLATSRLSEFRLEDGHIEAGAGFTLGGLAVRTSRAGYVGLEFAAGVPGSVGGGVFMNAGAHGGQMAEHIRRVGFLPLSGTGGGPATAPVGIEILEHDACAFAYRKSLFQTRPGVVVWAELFVPPGDPQESRLRLRQFQAERRAHQPLAWPNCGSVFRNPPGDHAGRLVEAVGGKGKQSGQAQISERHGNFIVNRGGATAADVLGLIEWAREAVMRSYGVELELEIRVVPA